ncbi:MAG: TIM-barrel domain-containing protein [Pseudomonadota bacterium]
MRVRALPSFVLVLLLATGCGGGGDRSADTPTPDPDAVVGEDSTLDVPGIDGGPAETTPSDGTGEEWLVPPGTLSVEGEGGASLTLHTDPLGMVLSSAAGEILWDGADTPLLFGFVDEKNEALRYDSSMVPSEVVWTAPGPVEAYRPLDGGGVVLRLPLGGDDQATWLLLSVAPGGEGIITLEATPEDTTHVVLVRLGYAPLGPQENFYGLGENYDHPARRGTLREMHFMPILPSESGYNEAHVPIPLLISTAGSALFVEDRNPGTWDVAMTDPERVVATWAVPAAKFHLLWAGHPMDVLPRYYELTGYPALPPIWAFGILQWQDEVDGQAMVMDDALSMRALDLPCSAIWIDRPYAVPHTYFEFDENYPDAAQMVTDLNDLGYRVAIWSAPYLSKDLEAEYAFAAENDFFVEGDVQYEKFGTLMDFTNPEAVAFWRDLVHLATDIGIEGFKLDYGEDVQAGFGPIKLNFNFYSGEPAQVMHKKYAWYYHLTYEDTVPGGSFQLNRAGTYGDQSVTDVIWPGDLDADFRFHMEEDFYVGGLPAAIAAGLSLSTSGYPFFGSDTGGYRNNRPTEEVLLRWVAQTAASTTLQFGGAGANCNPWDFTEYLENVDWQEEPVVSKYDEGTVETWRRFARLHIRLFPYTYTQAVAAVSGGRPVLRPYGFALPEAGEHPDFVYFHGEHLLVAPVYREEMDPEVPLPPGDRWVSWWTGEAWDGGATVVFPQPPLNQSVLLVREGAVIPMLRPTVDTLAPATDPEVDSYGNDPGRLWLVTCPAAKDGPETTVFDGSTAILKSGGSHWTLEVGQGDTFTGWVAEVRLHAAGGPAAVDVVTDGEGASLEAVGTAGEVEACDGCWFLDEDAKTLWIGLGPGDGAVSFGPAL